MIVFKDMCGRGFRVGDIILAPDGSFNNIGRVDSVNEDQLELRFFEKKYETFELIKLINFEYVLQSHTQSWNKTGKVEEKILILKRPKV